MADTDDFHGDLLLRSRNSWNHWKNLQVKWPCQTNSSGKQTLLQLYHEIDILAWFRDNESSFPGIAILARIYLGNTFSTAAQDRFFSMSSNVVNDLRTSLDEDRAEMLCLMKSNWSEYRAQLNHS
ncbi:hypothetical protein JG688_00002653 [Phytophthora aleatoria]|uniref:HAT C-terminal dimerisation domain-containing protein n=1 Tax=Phytophthora aleatoria TaxID=2496075 RepID=A0A8J5J3V7_9STRA|nr:hypothetical protein JG688_00002653 [Phytophthora aleatoria]